MSDFRNRKIERANFSTIVLFSLLHAYQYEAENAAKTPKFQWKTESKRKCRFSFS